MKYRIRSNELGTNFKPEWSRFGIFWNGFPIQTGAESMGIAYYNTLAQAQSYIDFEKRQDAGRRWRTL